LSGSYRGYDVYTIGPPSSGCTLLEMMNMLEGYDLAGMGHNTAKYLHILTEVMRLSQLDRVNYLGDPQWNPSLPLKKLLSKEYASILRNRIDPSKASASRLEEVTLAKELGETTHFSSAGS